MKILDYVKKSITSVVPAVLLSVCLAGSFISGITVYADEETSVAGISIPVTVRNASGKVILEAVEPDAPMPEQTELLIGKDEKKSFGPISYEVPGDYHYKIYQRSGNDKDNAKNVGWDSSVYEVTVRVTSSTAKELEAVIWCQKEGSEGKSEDITFLNTVNKETDIIRPIRKQSVIKTVKTGDTAPIAVLAALSGLSAGTLAAVERWKRKKEK